MTNMLIEISNGFAKANRRIDSGFTVEEYNSLPSEEQFEISRDVAAEAMDIGEYVRKGMVVVTVSIGYVNCKAEIGTNYTEEEWKELSNEEQETIIMECAWELVNYWEVENVL